MNLDKFKDHWRGMISTQEKFPHHHKIYSRGFKEDFLIRLLPEIHFLLQEELRSLETSSVVTRGLVQDVLQKVYRHAYDQRKQIQSIELDLEMGERAWSVKPRPETLSYSSYSFYALNHLSPLSFLGPYFHFHFFMLEAASKMKGSKLRIVRDFSRQRADFEILFEELFQQLDPENLKFVLESLSVSLQIFEYLLLVTKRQKSPAKRVLPGLSLERSESSFGLFHERRSSLLQT